jgi:hypothetical protein
MTFKLFIALSGFGGAVFVLLFICLRGVCYIPQDEIGIVEKSGRLDLVLCRLSFGIPGILACP